MAPSVLPCYADGTRMQVNDDLSLLHARRLLTATVAPTEGPTDAPTMTPTAGPTSGPSASPTAAPTASPTIAPTNAPSIAPSSGPSGVPSQVPTAQPTVVRLPLFPSGSPVATIAPRLLKRPHGMSRAEQGGLNGSNG